MNTLTPRVKMIVQPGSRTTLIEINLLASNIATNRVIKWNEITFPDQWTIPQAISAKPLVNQEFDQILQTSYGDAEVRFNTRRSINHLKNSIPSTIGEEIRSKKSNESEIESNPGLILNQNKILQPLRGSQEFRSPSPSEMNF